MQETIDIQAPFFSAKDVTIEPTVGKVLWKSFYYPSIISKQRKMFNDIGESKESQ